MPTNVTYTSLFQDVTRYLERGGSALTDPTVHDQIPRLINAAERKLAQELKLLGQIEVLTTTLQTGVAIIAKPDRWRQTISMFYGTGTTQNTRTRLFSRSYEFLTTYWPDRSVSDADNPPLYYAEDYQYAHWLIGPTPDQNYPLEVSCYMQPPLLDDSNQTNFWTDYTPNALLYGTLLEATPFLKDDPRLQVWGQQWERDLASLGNQDLQRKMDRAAERRTN